MTLITTSQWITYYINLLLYGANVYIWRLLYNDKNRSQLVILVDQIQLIK